MPDPITQQTTLINPSPFMYVLHNLQGQFWGTQDLMECLKSTKFEHTLSLSGNIVFHTMGPKDRKEFSPLYTLLTLGLTNLSPNLVTRSLLLRSNMSFIRGRQRLL